MSIQDEKNAMQYMMGKMFFHIACFVSFYCRVIPDNTYNYNDFAIQIIYFFVSNIISTFARDDPHTGLN